MRLTVGIQQGWHWAMLGSYLSSDSWQSAAMAVWCRQTFGPPGNKFDDAEVRWRDQFYDGMVYFRDEADLAMFVLRWGN